MCICIDMYYMQTSYMLCELLYKLTCVDILSVINRNIKCILMMGIYIYYMQPKMIAPVYVLCLHVKHNV